MTGTQEPGVRAAEATPEGATNARITTKDTKSTKSERRHGEFHKRGGITRDFLTDCISDVSTLELEDETDYYLIACDNSGTFENVFHRMKLPNIQDTVNRDAVVLMANRLTQTK